MKKIAAILLRVSTEEQTLGESLKAQEGRLFELAERKDFARDEIKVFEIVESSTIGGRRKFYEMMDWIKEQEGVVCLFVEAIDRLQRSFKESPVLDELRLIGKLEITFYKEGITLHKDSTPTDLMMWDFSVIGAKMFVQSISHNVKRSNERKRLNGEILGAAPLGYLNVPNAKGKDAVVVDPERGFMIAKAFQEYAKGISSLQDITVMLKKWGLRSKKGQVIPKASVHNILKNPFYMGIIEYKIKGKKVIHPYERLIDKETFDTCQEVRLSYGKKPFKYAAKPYIFRGLLRCAHCGCTISPDQSKGNIYWFCSKYKGNCEQKRVKEEKLVAEMEKAFKKIEIPQTVLNELQDRLQKSQSAKKQFQNDALKGLDTEYRNIQKKLDALLELHLDGSITKELYNQKSQEFRQRQEEILDEKRLFADADEKFAITLTYLLSLAARSYEIFKSSKADKKRELISLVLWNPRLERGKLVYDYQKPFDVLARAAKCKNWLPRLDSNQ